MQIPVLNGVYTDGVADFRTSYPVNMVPVPKEQGISNGYLRPAEGLVQDGLGPGASRGGINWNGICYRVMGTKLVSVDSEGAVRILGDVGEGGQCTFDYSFDRLGISSGGRLYYWSGSVLSQVTDPDIGTVTDFVWVDGYFMTNDGQSLIVTEPAIDSARVAEVAASEEENKVSEEATVSEDQTTTEGEQGKGVRDIWGRQSLSRFSRRVI